MRRREEEVEEAKESTEGWGRNVVKELDGGNNKTKKVGYLRNEQAKKQQTNFQMNQACV